MSTKNLIILLGVGGALLFLMRPKDKGKTAGGLGSFNVKPRRVA